VRDRRRPSLCCRAFDLTVLKEYYYYKILHRCIIKITYNPKLYTIQAEKATQNGQDQKLEMRGKA